MKKPNEINACNALIDILQKLTGALYECESCPDEVVTNKPEPDFILRSTCAGATKIAAEHTVIELFNGQISYVISSFERAEEINRICRGKIPEDRWYYIAAPHALINSLTDRKRRKAFDEDLAPWIAEQAPNLQIDDFKQHSYNEHKVTLICGGSHPLRNGTVGRIPERPADTATLQKDAFLKAIQHGLQKLRDYKCNPPERFETVLLLEDIAGLNRERVITGLTTSEKAEIDHYIDYVVVLASYGKQMITGYVWKENETWHEFIPYDKRFSFA